MDGFLIPSFVLLFLHGILYVRYKRKWQQGSVCVVRGGGIIPSGCLKMYNLRDGWKEQNDSKCRALN